MVSDASLACMVVAAVISFGAPVVALVVARRRLHVQFKAVLVGALVFVVFAGFLEQLAHALAFSAFPDLRSTPVAFVLYAALAAGAFEELGAAAVHAPATVWEGGSWPALRHQIQHRPWGDRGHDGRGSAACRTPWPCGAVRVDWFCLSGQLLVGILA